MCNASRDRLVRWPDFLSNRYPGVWQDAWALRRQARYFRSALRTALTSVRPAVLAVTLIPAVTAPASESPPVYLWAEKTGGSGSDVGYGVAADSGGNVFVAGSFSMTNSLGSSNLVSSGLTDVFIAKYSPGGNLLWARQAGGTGYDEGRGLIVDDSGNAYVTGHFQNTAAFGAINLSSDGQSDIFAAKYDPAGNVVWAQKAGGNDFDEGHAIALDGLGNIYLTGTFDKNASFGDAGSLMNNSGSSDVFVAKMDELGNFVWARQAGGGEEDNGAGLTLDSFGNVYVTGFFAGTATFGSTNLTSHGVNGLRDGFLTKYDNNGGFLWVQQIGGDNGDEARGVAADPAGDVTVTGTFTASSLFGTNYLAGDGRDIFVAKFNGAGNILWARRAGGNDPIYGDSGQAIKTDTSGNIYLTGFFSGTAAFGTNTVTTTGFDDVFVAKYNSDGIVLWVRQAGGSLLDVGYGIAVGTDNNVYLTGFFYGTATFGSTTLISSGVDDLFASVLSMAEAPRISITATGATISLSWPVWASSFLLESTGSLETEPIQWSIVPTSTNQLFLEANGEMQLFRLREP